MKDINIMNTVHNEIKGKSIVFKCKWPFVMTVIAFWLHSIGITLNQVCIIYYDHVRQFMFTKRDHTLLIQYQKRLVPFTRIN